MAAKENNGGEAGDWVHQDPDSPCARAFGLFQDAWTRGEAPDPEVFCAGHPECGPELLERIQDFLFVARMSTADAGGTQVAEGSKPLPPPPSVEPTLPETIGPYKVLRLLGEGGMGAVYLVEQTEPVRRRAALKLIRKGMDSRGILKRFEAERQALVMMSHPNIARVLDAGGSASGQPYFVMEYIDGPSISEYCRSRRLGIPERIRLFMKVLEGVRHAHQRGVIHRDLKPGNILVEEIDGEPVPKIIDFGLARAVGESLVEGSFHTLAGQVIGTPEYMSPEQAGYLDQDVDSRTDIYSLGIVLYELLTGAHPFGGPELRKASLLQIQKIIFESEPPKPSSLVARQWKDRLPLCGLDSRTLARRLKGDLDWILLKALEKDRERRYQTAGEFLEDLRRHLDHEPVLAGPPSIAYKTKKILRKHGLALAAGLAVLVSIFGSLLFSLQEARARAKKEQALRMRLQKTLEYARSTANSLLSMAVVKQKQEEKPSQPLWKEDFETYPRGRLDLSPSSKGRWVSGGGLDENVRIVGRPGEVKGSGLCLELEGRTDHADGAIVSTPLDPENRSYLPDFTVEFEIHPSRGKIEGRGFSRGSLDICTSRHWGGKKGFLFSIGRDWKIYIASGGLLPEPFPSGDESFHHVRIHYRRVDQDTVRLTYFIDTRKIHGKGVAFKTWTMEREAFSYEDRLVWLQVSSGAGKTWFDNIKVARVARAQFWRKCPYPPNHEYMLTPSPVTRARAEALARRMGGALAEVGSEDIRRWIFLNFGQADFWVAGEERDGRYPCLACARLPRDQGIKIPGIQWRRGDLILPGILEFPVHPPVASAIKTGTGCPGLLKGAPRLLAASPPVAGKSLEVVLEGVPPGTPSLLAAGTWEVSYDLSFTGLPNCKLRVVPEVLLPLEPKGDRWNSLFFRRPLPRDPSLFGATFFLQGLVTGKGREFRPAALSNGLRLRVGIDPPRGSLAWAFECGMSSSRDKKPKLGGLEALPGGGALLAGSFLGSLAFPSKMESWLSPGDWPLLKGRGSWDGFLARAGPFGRIRWAKILGGEGEDRVESLRLLPGGKRTLLLGLFQDEVSFGGGKGACKLNGPNEGDGIFAALYSVKDGSLVRAWKIGEGERVDGLRLAVVSTPEGTGFYTCGVFYGRLTLGEGKGKKTLQAGKGGALFLARFSAAGRLVWARMAGASEGGLQTGGICVLPGGSVALAGNFKRNLEIGREGEKRLVYYSPGFQGYYYWDMFLACFRADGSLAWCRHALGETDDFARDLTCASDGTIFLSGGFHHTVKFWEKKKAAGHMEMGSGGGLNPFVARFRGDGMPIWGVRGAATGGTGQAMHIAIHEENGKVEEIYVTGHFDHVTDFRVYPYRPGFLPWGGQCQPYSVPLVPMGKGRRKDVFVLCLRPNGETAWATQAGGIGDDQGLYLSLAADGSPLVGGNFMGPATFGYGEPNQAVLVQGTLFLAKFRK